MILIKNGLVFSPEPLGKKDLLLSNVIEAVDDDVNVKNIEEIDAEKLFVTPGFIDMHLHINGAGGEGGPATRTLPLTPNDMIFNGITTVIGLLGTDGYTRSLFELLYQVRRMKAYGVNAYMLTGSYQVPSPTLTGSISKDILIVPEIMGVKIALSDHRSSYPTRAQLIAIASEARVSGMLSSKPGYVHAHMGDGKDYFDPILDVVDHTEIPIKQFLPTHIERNNTLFHKAVEFAMKGGNLDITIEPEDKAKTLENIKFLLSKKVPIENITLSSDGNGSLSKFDNDGVLIEITTSPVNSIIDLFKYIYQNDQSFTTQFLKAVTDNAAKRLGIKKGRIQKGYDSDLLLFDKKLKLVYVIINGKIFKI
jgi:beta-aspartyl-dipeptidase (metallo-type)